MPTPTNMKDLLNTLFVKSWSRRLPPVDGSGFFRLRRRWDVEWLITFRRRRRCRCRWMSEWFNTFFQHCRDDTRLWICRFLNMSDPQNFWCWHDLQVAGAPKLPLPAWLAHRYPQGWIKQFEQFTALLCLLSFSNKKSNYKPVATK